MGEDYGFVLVALYPFCSLVCSALIFKRRKHGFIRCRNPSYIIVQNMGSMISSIFLSLYIGLRPHYSCSLFYVGLTAGYSLFAAPLLLRSWEYCVNFHISLLKLHYRSCYYLNWKKTSWVFEHRWIGSRKFLNKALIGFMCLMGLTTIVSAFPSQFTYNTDAQACVMTGSPIYLGLAAGIIFIFIAIGMGFLIYRSQDVYHIKRELNSLALLWAVILVTFVIYSKLQNRSTSSFPACTFILIGYFFTLVYCSVVPLIYAWQFDKRMRGAHGNLGNFKSLLESVEFRNKFHDFLTKQFSQENLQFYEVVMEWKLLRVNDTERATKARAIIDVFVNDGSVCQVNIPDETRTKIIKESHFEEIPVTIFDNALAGLIEDMHVNSYRQYCSLRETSITTYDYESSSELEMKDMEPV